MAKCPEYIRLRSEVENVLGNLAQVTTLLLELFRNDESERYKHLDKELELTDGEKERAVGALRQHIKEHKCQPEKSSQCVAVTLTNRESVENQAISLKTQPRAFERNRFSLTDPTRDLGATILCFSNGFKVGTAWGNRSVLLSAIKPLKPNARFGIIICRTNSSRTSSKLSVFPGDP